MKKLPEVFVTFPAVFGNTKECEERKEDMKEEKAEAKERKYRIRSQDVLDGGSGLRMAAAIRHVTWYLE